MLAAPPAVAADEADPWSLGGSVGAVTNYVARGLTQTWGGPAVQGELEFEHDAGAYAGLSASNVSRNQYPGGGVETTLWLGYEHEFRKDASLAVEGLYYAYPGSNADKGSCGPARCPAQSFDTLQGRLVGAWDWISARYAYTFGDYFGASPATGYTAGTRGTWYADVDAKPELPGAETWQLVLHAGYTHYSAKYSAAGTGAPQNPNYWDWKVGVAKTFKDASGAWRLGLDYTQASNAAFYDNTRSLADGSTRSLGRAAVAFTVAREF